MQFIQFFFILIFAGLLLILILNRTGKNKGWKKPVKAFPSNWRIILVKKVSFYNQLTKEEKERFEYKVHEFLINCRITGIETNIDDTDRLLVASSAIIPIFEFPEWQYINLSEVLLYPSEFNEKFETTGKGRAILGMVGTGYMEGKMILSKPALIHGFLNESDKKNTAIHEFVHLVDKADGKIDGIPSLLLEKQYAIPWIDLIQKKIDEIYIGRSDINPYGATNSSEFFAVACEYFFERPKLLKSKHPELYDLLENIFNQDLAAKNKKQTRRTIGRNDPCPCSSGIKFKKCCGRIHYQNIPGK